MQKNEGLNKYSSILTQRKSQGASQAMLLGTGLTEEDLNKPQVGIASIWYEGNTCNMHLQDFSERVKKSVTAEDMVGMRFNTIGVSDGISMGTSGMSYSLVSREIIADSIEAIMQAHFYDALIALPGCDKNMPGCLIAMARLNRPAIMVYGGTIRAGCTKGKQKVDIVSAFQSYGQFIAGHISEEERKDIIRHACPGPGACGGMYTANTMAVAIETLGMSLPFSSSYPAESPEKLDECLRVGLAIKKVMELGLTPKMIMTKKSFENALIMVMALGGSTNAVLHLIAMARSLDIPLKLEDIQAISDRIPLLADMKPGGTFVMEDLYHVGGAPAVMKYLLEAGLLDGSTMTVTGLTLAQNLEHVPALPEDQKIIRQLKRAAIYKSLKAIWLQTDPLLKSQAKKASILADLPVYLTVKKPC
jgi:dihydroxy-acid dehydratase